MDKILAFSIISIIFLMVTIFLFVRNRKKSEDNSMEKFIITEQEDNKFSQKKEPEINITAFDFKVVGNKDKYIISFKGDKVQFFVKNDEIIGFLDVEKSNKTYYYEKEKIEEDEDKNV